MIKPARFDELMGSLRASGVMLAAQSEADALTDYWVQWFLRRQEENVVALLMESLTLPPNPAKMET